MTLNYLVIGLICLVCFTFAELESYSDPQEEIDVEPGIVERDQKDPKQHNQQEFQGALYQRELKGYSQNPKQDNPQEFEGALYPGELKAYSKPSKENNYQQQTPAELHQKWETIDTDNEFIANTNVTEGGSVNQQPNQQQQQQNPQKLQSDSHPAEMNGFRKPSEEHNYQKQTPVKLQQKTKAMNTGNVSIANVNVAKNGSVNQRPALDSSKVYNQSIPKNEKAKSLYSNSNADQRAETGAEENKQLAVLDDLAEGKATPKECKMKKNGKSDENCKTTFIPQEGSDCKFYFLATELFPGVEFKVVSKGILTESDKFSVMKMTVQNCKSKQNIEFEMTATEAAETNRYLVLSSGTKLTLQFNYKKFINGDDWDSAKLTCDGFTDVGKDTRCKVTCSKSYKDDDVSIIIEKDPIFATDFFEKFHINTEDILPKDKDEERKALNLNNLKFDKSVFAGMMSDEGLTEFYVTGEVSGSAILGEKVYLVAQNVDNFHNKIRMSGGILVKFSKEDLNDKLQAITGEATSEKLFKVPILSSGGKEMFMGIAAGEIPLIYSNEVRNEFKDSIGPGSAKYLEPGLIIKYNIADGYETFKMTTEQKQPESLLVHLEVQKNKYIFSCPDRVSMVYSTLTGLLTPKGGIPSMGLEKTQKVRFVKSVVEQTSNGGGLMLNVFFSPSPEVKVIGNGILTLANTTFNMERDASGEWLLHGAGEETILTQLTNTTITQDKDRTVLIGDCNIFNMDMLSDRAGSEYLDSNYGESFNHTRSFSVSGLQYEANFEKPNVLRLKGKASVCDCRNATLEVMIFFSGNKPAMAVGLVFRRNSIYNIIHSLYGKKKEPLLEAWMKFENVGITMRKKGKQEFKFNSKLLNNAEERPDYNGGISLFAQNLMLKDCSGLVDKEPKTVSKFCAFLASKIGNKEVFPCVFYGTLGPDKFNISAQIERVFKLGHGLEMKNIDFQIQSKKKGQRAEMFGDFLLPSLGDGRYKGKIYVDGTDKLILKMKEPESVKTLTKFGESNYCFMNNLKSVTEIPVNEDVKVLEFQSEIIIGLRKTAATNGIKFPNTSSVQRIDLNDSRKSKLYAAIDKIPMKDLFAAFDVENNFQILGNTVDLEDVKVTYNGEDTPWEICEEGITAEKGLHIKATIEYSKAKLINVEIDILDGPSLKIKMTLPSMYWCKNRLSATYKQNDDSIGPIFTVMYENGKYKSGNLKGYMQTFGFHGDNEILVTQEKGDNYRYTTSFSGQFYEEIPGTLNLEGNYGGSNISEIEFKMSLDLTDHVANEGESWVKKYITDIQETAKASLKTADEHLRRASELHDNYQTKQSDLGEQKSNVSNLIKELKVDIDTAAREASRECINECPTVAMPGLVWDDNCVKPSSGQKIKCLKWQVDKERCMDIACLVKCEAKRASKQAKGSIALKHAQVLINSFKHMKILSDAMTNVDSKTKASLEYAKATSEMITKCTSVPLQLAEGLSESTSSIYTLEKIAVNKLLKEITNAPCMPFKINWQIYYGEKGENVREKDMEIDLCFNGRFMPQFAKGIIHAAFPELVVMEKTLDKCSARYKMMERQEKNIERLNATIRDAIENGKLVEDAIKPEEEIIVEEEAKKTGNVEQKLDDDTEKRSKIPSLDPFLNMGRSLSSRFTVMGDKTLLAFHKYSPWAVLKETDPFKDMPDYMKFGKEHVETGRQRDMSNKNTSRIEDSPCNITRKTIQNFLDAGDILQTWTKSYSHGKVAMTRAKRTLQSGFDYLEHEIHKTATETDIADRSDIMYWLRYTKSGVRDWINESHRQVEQHNQKGMGLLKRELDHVFQTNQHRGFQDYISHLGQTGGDAYKRVNVPRRSDSVINGETFSRLSQDFMRAFNSPITLSGAAPLVDDIVSKVAELDKETLSCNY